MTVLAIMSTATSLIAQSMQAGPQSSEPPSFNGAASLFMFNLFAMTASTFFGSMMSGKQARRIWLQRKYDHPKDPVTIYRAILMFAEAASERAGPAPIKPDTAVRLALAWLALSQVAEAWQVEQYWKGLTGLRSAEPWMSIADCAT